MALNTTCFSPPDNLYFAVGSTNEAKIRAVENAVNSIFAGSQCFVLGFKIDSAVNAQPVSAEETIQGATYRAKIALEKLKSSGLTFEKEFHLFGVGLEGGIEKVGNSWFECGWCCVTDGETINLGSSARFKITDNFAADLLKGREMADLVAERMDGVDKRDGLGMMGVITGGHLPRGDCYSHGVIFAFVPWLSEAHWWRDENNLEN